MVKMVQISLDKLLKWSTDPLWCRGSHKPTLSVISLWEFIFEKYFNPNFACVLSFHPTYTLHTESATIDDFGSATQMTPQDLENLKMIFISMEQGDLGILKALGIMVSQLF